jgi:serralysin
MADSGILKLTDAVNEQASFILYTKPVDATKGLSITFDFFSYGGKGGTSGGTGGDGIGFFFIDGSKSPTKPGGFGGSLGYAQRDILNSGIEGGYLGVGFDEFGNYSNGVEGRIGGPGQTPDSIAVRGSQATGYKYLTGTGTLPVSLDNPGPQANRTNSRRRAQVDLTPTGLLTVQIDLNNDGDFADPGEKPVNALNVIAAGNGPLPTTFKFGFAGSTGAATNIHEVGNFKVTTFDGLPVSGNFGSIQVNGGSGNDNIKGTPGNDTLNGGTGSDTQTGGRGGDRFVFAGASKAAALKTSLVKKPDKITDFRFSEGDRFQLNFDNNPNTIEKPKGVFNAGKITARNLTEAAKFAYADRDFKKRGTQGLKKNEAVFFKLGSRTYLSVNDNKNPFSPKTDLVADVTGIQFKTGDMKKGALSVNSYFA